MDLLLDLHGFVIVVVGAADLVARTVLLGATGFWVLLAAPLAAGRGHDAGRLEPIARRGVLGAGAATLALTLLGAGINTTVLTGTLQAPLARMLGADFVLANLAAALAGGLLLTLAWPTRPAGPGRRAALALAALALIGASVATAHAVARTEGRALLLLGTALHQAGAALWLGGLPALHAALRLDPATARAAGQRYSVLAASGVGLILTGILIFWAPYLGTVEALYGTAYGAMASTKGVLLVGLLAFGAANFLLLHRLAARPDGLFTVRRLVECEMAAGVAVLALAASLTSVPPGADLPNDRVTWAEVAERFTPHWPRIASPDRADLAIPALQARLDSEFQARQGGDRQQAFTPGEGFLPPRNAQDIAWSEYNHHWAGFLVLLVGLAALADATGRVRLARHWPLLFLGLAGFVLLRSDPEVWPLGDIPLITSLRDPEVVQHKLAATLVAGFAVTEWSVRLGRLRGATRLVFPLAMLGGGVLLLTHSHAVANVKEALLIELSHLSLAVLAVVGGAARWLELRAPPALARRARWVWPSCLVALGAILLIYREA